MTFFWGEGCSFFIKNKLKSEIFNDKELYKEVTEKPIYRGKLPKKGGGGLGQFPGLRGVWQKRRGGDTLMHTMIPLQQNRQRIS